MKNEVGDYFKRHSYNRVEGRYLCVEQVIQIYAMLSCDVPVYHIGAHFGVSSMLIYHIRNGARWGWVRNKLLEEGNKDPDLKHIWIPDDDREGRFKCQECGMAYDKIMMQTTCPVRAKNNDNPIYMSWVPPEPKKPKEPKVPIPGADLPKMRAWKRKVEDVNAKSEAAAAKKREAEAAKAEKKQRLRQEVEQLRIREAMAKLSRPKTSPNTAGASAGGTGSG